MIIMWFSFTEKKKRTIYNSFSNIVNSNVSLYQGKQVNLRKILRTDNLVHKTQSLPPFVKIKQRKI